MPTNKLTKMLWTIFVVVLVAERPQGKSNGFKQEISDL